MSPRGVWRGFFTATRGSASSPTALFLTQLAWKCVIVKKKKRKLGDGFLTSAQEDFSGCFENDRRATRGKET